MGIVQSSDVLKTAIIRLKHEPISRQDDEYWQKLWPVHDISIDLYFECFSAEDLRFVRDFQAVNLATLCYKSIDRISQAIDNNCVSLEEQQVVINCSRLLTRILPFVFESDEWDEFFWTTLTESKTLSCSYETQSLAHSLISNLLILLFCPDFTVGQRKTSEPDQMVNLNEIDSCEYIWEPGVGCSYKLPQNSQFQVNRIDILKLFLTCLSKIMYFEKPSFNRWVTLITNMKTPHKLPLFTSLLNTVFSYDPIGYGLPYNYLLTFDFKEALTEVSLQLMLVLLDDCAQVSDQERENENTFINFLSRIYLDEDFEFIFKGVIKFLKNTIIDTYLPNSLKKISFHEELLIFFWKLCDYNKQFLNHVLQSEFLMDLVEPLICFLSRLKLNTENFGLSHSSLYILLLFSGFRNFGVKLNKLCTLPTSYMDCVIHSGSGADLLIAIFHSVVSAKNHQFKLFYKSLMIILVNVSPYLKSLKMSSCNLLLKDFEILSTPEFLFEDEENYIFSTYFIEMFNNIIQYQFDGNSNLVYCIIKQKQLFDYLNEITEAKIEKIPNSRKKWATNANWLTSVKDKFQLKTISRMLHFLIPEVQKLGTKSDTSTIKLNSVDVLQFLQNYTLVGLLPVPHPILMRKYQPNKATKFWFLIYTWTTIYLRNMKPAIWHDTDQKLFKSNENILFFEKF